MIQKEHYRLLWDENENPVRGLFSVQASILRMLASILKNQRKLEKKIDKLDAKIQEAILG